MSALFAVLGLVIQPITGLPEGSLGDVRLHLDADRPTYFLGEPVRLTLEVRNEGDQGVWGDFGLTWGTAEADVLLELLRLRSGTAETSATERQLYDDLRSEDPEQH